MAFAEPGANKQFIKRAWIDDIKSFSVKRDRRNEERVTKFRLSGHTEVNSKVTTQVAVYRNKNCAEADKGRFMEALLRKRNRGEVFDFVTNEEYEELGLPVPLIITTSIRRGYDKSPSGYSLSTSRSRCNP